MNTYFIQGREFNKSQLELWAWRGLKEGPGWEKGHYLFILHWLSAADHFILRTSGSTGEPKEIRLERQTMEASARMTAGYFGLTGGMDILLCLPSAYIAGRMMLVRAMVNGLKLTWVEPTSTPVAEIKSEFEFTAMTPMQAQKTLESSPQAFGFFRKMILGGAPVSASLEAALQHVPTHIYESYGMTETSSHVALRQVNHGEDTHFFHALPGISFSRDSRGCLVIHAPSLHQRELVTNDIVDLSGDTSFRWTGRADHVINSGGIKISPEQLERKLEAFMQHRFFVTATPDPLLGQKVTLCIESEPWPEADAQNLIQSLKQELLSHEVPREIRYMPRFNTTAGGKLLRSV